MRRLLLPLAAAALAVAVLAPAALAAGEIEGLNATLGDRDARDGAVAPTADQLAAVEALGADAHWNRFGTPSTLRKEGGFLATGIDAASAAEAARSFLDANKALFRLDSLSGLELVADNTLADSDAHAVLFRQRFGELLSADGGEVTVGVRPNGGSWEVFWVASSLTGDDALAADAQLSAVQAWTEAADEVDRSASVVNVLAAKDDGEAEWTALRVAGFSELQRARLVAVPTPEDGVRPAWETLVVDRGERNELTGYRVVVDAVTSSVLVRQDLVDRSHGADVQVVSGTVPEGDGACDVDKGPWVVLAGELEAIAVAGEATLAANDMVIKIKKDGVVVASVDTLTSPEAGAYNPSGGVPAGVYTVAYCDFEDGAGWEAPATYAGQVIFSKAGAELPTPKWKAFANTPPLAALNGTPWDMASTDTRTELSPGANDTPWDYSPRLGTPTFTTMGNNAWSAEAWANPPTVQLGNISPGATGYRPLSPTREYVFPWENRWYSSKCNPAEVAQPGVGADISAAAVNLFVAHNRMHDWAYGLGFTESTWNAQDSNYGKPGAERDAVIGDVQSGATTGGFPAFGGRDNANMLTLPDGIPPITNMYLWQPLRGAFYAPCVDGDYDMAVIGHEYGHMIENRMIGKGGTRSGHHAGAMGESNSDLMAMEIVNEYASAGQDGSNRYAVGVYATGNKERGIRNFGMNASPLNFSDMGYDLTGPQVHADGEIWSATQFDVRKALVDKYPGEDDAALQLACAEGEQRVYECPGNRRWIQLLFDAYLLMPTAPSMLEARDAMLAADAARFGGANQTELWGAFAKRGMGELAESTNTIADTATDPTPDFSSPRHDNANVTFRVVDESGDAVAAKVLVGRYEARVSPVADTDPATTEGENLDANAGFVPGTYEFAVVAPGHGLARFTETLSAGARVVTFRLATNWASAASGATAAGDGTNPANLIDDTEATSWVGAGAPVAGKQVTVDLGGGSHVIDRVGVSALLTPGAGQNRFEALRSFEIWTSADGSAFTKIFTSAEDAFPGVAPRPASPDLLLRTFDVPNTAATHVRLVVLANQCTGNAAFQGTQDADPTSSSDCRSGTEPEGAADGLLPPRDRNVVAAELQVFAAQTPGQGGGNSSGGGSSGGGDTGGGGSSSGGGGSSGGGSSGGGGSAGGGGAGAAPAHPQTAPGGVAGARKTAARTFRGSGVLAGVLRGKKRGTAYFRANAVEGENGRFAYTYLVTGKRSALRKVRFQATRVSTVRFAGKTVTMSGAGKLLRYTKKGTTLTAKVVRFTLVATDGPRADTVRVTLTNGYRRVGALAPAAISIQ